MPWTKFKHYWYNTSVYVSGALSQRTLGQDQYVYFPIQYYLSVGTDSICTAILKYCDWRAAIRYYNLFWFLLWFIVFAFSTSDHGKKWIIHFWRLCIISQITKNNTHHMSGILSEFILLHVKVVYKWLFKVKCYI